MNASTAPRTLAQKLIARACGRGEHGEVTPGEIVNCKVDLAMFHDSSGPRRLKPMLEELGAQIWDKQRVVLVMDHYVPERTDDARRIVRIARDWAREQDLPHVYDSMGICHVVVPQQGHIRPGMFCVGGDSHSPTGGAFGAYMFGIGATEMLGVVVTGEIWLRVPHTLQMHWSGALPRGVTAKDMMLHMIGRFGMNGGQYQAVEFTGSTVRGLSMQERMTLSNMSAEMGAQVGLIAPDETTMAWLAKTPHAAQGLASAGDLPITHWCTDGSDSSDNSDSSDDSDSIHASAPLTRHEFNAAQLEPQVAAPHSPANTHPVSHHRNTPVNLAYIGSCTGAKLDDMRAAAQVLRGRRVASGVRLMLAPASIKDQEDARAEGVLQILLDAGAQLFATACGACSGYGETLGDDVIAISTTARNFKGRMGSPLAQVYLASPYTVAASALRGSITDPREVLA